MVSGENEFNFISTPLPVSKFAVPAIPYEVEKDSNVHIASSDTTYATFAVGIDNVHKNISKIMGYTRSLDHIRTVAGMVGDTVTDNGDQVWKEEELYNNANGLRKVIKVKQIRLIAKLYRAFTRQLNRKFRLFQSKVIII